MSHRLAQTQREARAEWLAFLNRILDGKVTYHDLSHPSQAVRSLNVEEKKVFNEWRERVLGSLKLTLRKFQPQPCKSDEPVNHPSKAKAWTL